MRKSSKAVSLLLSGLMATSCFSMAAATVTAAEIGSEETCADKTAQDLIDEGHQLVFFQFPESLWGPNSNVKYNAKKKTCNVFCNLYAIYGNKTEIKTKSWEAPSTSMKKDSKASDIYYFDITESGQGVIEEGADYGILFSTKANAGNPDLTQPNTDGFQTSDLYFNYQCIGDTYSVTTPKATRENTANSQKITFKAESSNGIGKEIRKVTSLCAYLDGAKEGNAPDSLEMANQLKEYLPNSLNNSSFVWAKIEPILAQYGTTAQAVYDTYVEKFKDLHDAATPYVHEEGVDDLKDDGTLKDIYRYSYTITEEKDEATGVVTEKKIKYPDLDLVRERLNLPNEPVVTNIDAVEATISGAVEAGSALPEITGGDDTYSVSASWAPEAETAAYSTTYTATVTFTAAENYAFTDATTATLKDGTFENVTLNEDGTLTATVSYTTEDEPTTEPETTTEPEPEDVLIVAGSEAEIFGTGWDGTNEANKMAKADDGTYTKDYTVSKAYSAVQLKSVKNGADWIGDKSGANVTFDLTGAGTFTVVYDPVENYTYVTGDIVEEITEFKYDTVYAVGNGEGFWLNGASWDPAYAANEMNKVADDLWEIEFTDVPDGFERQIKFAIDGAWTHNFGGVFEESGVVSAAAYNGDNITFDTDDTCTVKAQLDLREFDFTTKEGAKFTVTIEYAEVEEIGIIGDVNGDGRVTVEDATLIQRRGIELEKFDETQEKLGDVNRDGRISILDVTCVQKYLAEMTDGKGEAGNKLMADGTIVPANLPE